jgi:predicted nucleic acid-binding protein
VALSWCFEDEGEGYADAVLDRLAGDGAVVPSIWPFEVLNGLIVGERRGRLTQAQSARFEDLLGALPIDVEAAPGRERWPILVSLAREHRLSAYDASYLELALRRSLPLATLDAQLVQALERSGALLLSA